MYIAIIQHHGIYQSTVIHHIITVSQPSLHVRSYHLYLCLYITGTGMWVDPSMP